MNDVVIARYKFSYEGKRYLIVENQDLRCSNVPSYFVIKKSDSELGKRRSEYVMYWTDLNNKSLVTGLRILRTDLYYGDRWAKDEVGLKSLFLIYFLDRDTIDIHFFDQYYPDNRSEFFTEYFSETQIAHSNFFPKSRRNPDSWKRKRNKNV